MRFTRCIIRNRAISIYLCAACLFVRATMAPDERTIARIWETPRARYVRHRREFRNRCYVRETRGWSRGSREEMCLSAFMRKWQIRIAGEQHRAPWPAVFFAIVILTGLRLFILSSSRKFLKAYRRLPGIMLLILLSKRICFLIA